MKQARKTLGIIALTLICLAVSTVHATPTDRIIIKVSETMRPAVLADGALAPRARERVSSLSAAVGHEVVYLRAMSGGADVVRLPRAMPLEQVQAMAEAMARLPGVEYAEPDARVFPMEVLNDPLFGQQWHLQPVRTTPPLNYGIDAPAAWSITTGEAVVVAIVDTGILFAHEDLEGKVLEAGYDFISADPDGEYFTANDGDGRDPDPSDPGDWVTEEEAEERECRVSHSSWHGTHMAGIVAASTSNGKGIAGVSWGAMILPIRALGKCDGYSSDVIDAMRWAAGLPVAGVPNNHDAAKIINMSLGANQSCTGAWLDAVNAVHEKGSLIVAAAGNGGVSMSSSRNHVVPGVCPGVLTVAATNKAGDRASFSNYGPQIDLGAPGIWVLSTSDQGTTSPLDDSHYENKSGTSVSAPQVAGVAALLLSYDDSLDRQDLIYLLTSNVTPYPEDSLCAAGGGCGSGVLNAGLALMAVTEFDGRPPPPRPASSGGGGRGNIDLGYNADLFLCISMHLE